MGPIGFGHPSEGLGSSQSLATLRSIQTATSCEVAEVDQPGVSWGVDEPESPMGYYLEDHPM